MSFKSDATYYFHMTKGCSKNEAELIFDFLEMNLKYCCPRNAINGLTPWMFAQEKTESDSNEADWLLCHTASKIFHTQGVISDLTLLAFDDEMYYICTEIWEEPRLPPFFVNFPLKLGF